MPPTNPDGKFPNPKPYITLKGRKMSKSLGNVVDPLEIIRDFGTDALRFTVATGMGILVCVLERGGGAAVASPLRCRTDALRCTVAAAECVCGGGGEAGEGRGGSMCVEGVGSCCLTFHYCDHTFTPTHPLARLYYGMYPPSSLPSFIQAQLWIRTSTSTSWTSPSPFSPSPPRQAQLLGRTSTSIWIALRQTATSRTSSGMPQSEGGGRRRPGSSRHAGAVASPMHNICRGYAEHRCCSVFACKQILYPTLLSQKMTWSHFGFPLYYSHTCFCCRYVLLMLQRADEQEWQTLRAVDFGTPASIAALPLAERWIVSQLHQVCWLLVSWLGWGPLT